MSTGARRADPMQPSRLCYLAALALLPLSARAQDRCGQREPSPGLLVSAEWLKLHQHDSALVVLQVERTRAPFDSAHVAGARFVAMGDFTTKRGDLLTELPPVEQLDSLLEALGVAESGQLVLYGETLPVTRLFFTLDYLGLGDRVSLLDGGVAAWRDAGGELTALPTQPPARATLSLHPRPELLADAAWVESHREKPNVTVLDVRTQEEFEGTKTEEGVARPGHIPGAKHLDWTETMSGGRFRPPNELRQLLTGVGASANRELVVYCRVGTRASEMFFVARLLGFPVRLYDGSMNDWSSRKELPVVGPKPE